MTRRFTVEKRKEKREKDEQP